MIISWRVTVGTVVDDNTIECLTPAVIQTIGPKRCEVRFAIGVSGVWGQCGNALSSGITLLMLYYLYIS